MNFDQNSRKTIKSLAKFWNSSRFRSSRLWNPGTTAVVLPGNPEIIRYPIQCRPWGVEVGYFLDKPILFGLRPHKIITINIVVGLDEYLLNSDTVSRIHSHILRRISTLIESLITEMVNASSFNSLLILTS